ncbi:hypothetical protein M426DRAFT_316248 [Hypoxylon sp. CI-4A]|nr:hypothetical protein M426DRAFT_316248 [Hypoxylon sp. CI-4A]
MSTRSQSPGENMSAPTSPQLSPRSKIQALLATVNDADSDDEASGPTNAKIPLNTTSKPIITDPKPQPTNDSDVDDEDEEEEIIRPRGRLAARMRANDEITKHASLNPTHDGATSPREPTHLDATPTNAEDDEEEDITTLPRRRLTRPVREATPEITIGAEAPSSPGLFVTPAPETPKPLRQSAAESDTDDELPENLGKNERFMALVAKKRQERLAKEAEEERKRKERAERMAEQVTVESDDDDASDITDDDAGRKLTQSGSRPVRKASKKALEEMNRETQRISRSLQLGHEAKTKKKITKASLFERFNFRTEAAPKDNKPPSSSRPTTPGSVQQTDVDMADGTPPSSPPLASNPVEKPDIPLAPGTSSTLDDILEDNGELPTVEEMLTQRKKEDKGKGKAIETTANVSEVKKGAANKPKRQVRVKLPPMQANLVTIDSDDELEITNSKKGRLSDIFDRIPEKKAQEPMSMSVLRRLAHLSSPKRESTRGRNAKPSMTPAELQMTLQQRARAQAKLERERRLEFLRSKGITVQTEEERRKEREQVEDIVARARQEVEEIMQRERDDAKKARKEKKENGENDPLAWDDSDDDSFEESEEDAVDIELSGSEEDDEAQDEDMEDAEDEGEPAANPMFEDEAIEDIEPEEEHTPKANVNTASDDEADDELPAVRSRRTKKHAQIVSDDEDDVEATPKPKASQPKSPSATNSGSPKVPTSVLRSATKTFIPGLPIPAAKPAGLGLTQIFAGTMDDSQVGPASGSPLQFMPSLEYFPDSQFSATAGQSQNDMVPNSQQNGETQGAGTETQGVQLHFSQSQMHGFGSLMQMDGTQISELIEPTQDAGFQDFSPLKQRFVDAPQSTVDTVLIDGTPNYENVQESPLVKRRGKLRRRGENPIPMSSVAATNIPETSSNDPSIPATNDTNMDASAFKIMEKAARRKKRMQEKFDKKKSKATGMVEEQAEESEDEYAGLGGADGEDSSEEDEELVKEMIDDAAGNNADEAKLAGFYADRERAADAAQVDKLFRDITTGMLRKRRRGGGGNDFDLSDSDDGGEARRRMKRRQFAKMQKALFADERIGKIAENPRNAAFLKSIEDRNSDDEWDFDNNFVNAATEGADSESQSQGEDQGRDVAAGEQSIPDSQPTNNERKRPNEEDHSMRPPPNARRSKGRAHPSSLTDVRRELSDLLDEPNGSAASIIPATEIGSDSEDDERPRTSSGSSGKENRRTNVAVVDRIKLKRDSSSLSTTSNGGASSRLAFAAPSASGSNGLFKVPGLLRRATTNSLISNSSTSSHGGGSSSSNTTGASGLSKMGGEDGKLKKTAGKRSGINYFARENERRAAVADAEKRREAKKWKGVEGRSKAVGGLFGGGTFE